MSFSCQGQKNIMSCMLRRKQIDEEMYKLVTILKRDLEKTCLQGLAMVAEGNCHDCDNIICHYRHRICHA